jgi:putative ATP-dependent endonuclease of the OLD family
MKLASFSVQNYRSITKAYKIPLEDMTVLIGPNNEGKSNVVRALVTALQVLEALARMPPPYRDRIVGVGRFTDYEWERDFPVRLQESKPAGESVFGLEFELSQDERKEFRSEVRSKLTGTLPIQIALGPDRAASFKVVKKGPGGPALSKKPGLIGRFIARRLDLEYIPAVRTAGRAQQVVDDLVARALVQAEGDPAYRNALDAIAEIQAPLLAKISTTIKDTLSVFLPDVEDVAVQIPQEQRSRALRSCQIIVNDGAPTLLQNKGDGMQSLAALSLMRHASRLGAGERELVLAIEEPESHLHPRAIHQLKAVLKEISEQHQIIMTTHCPLGHVPSSGVNR